MPNVGTTQNLKLTANGTYESAVWSSSDEAIATIAATGTKGETATATFVAPGTVTFTVTVDTREGTEVNNISATKEYTVTEPEATTVAIEEA